TGMKVKKEVHDPNATAEEYTLVIAPGKLIKKTPKEVTIATFKEEKNVLRTFDPELKTEVQVLFDGSKMQKTAKRIQATPGEAPPDPDKEWEAITGEYTLRPGPNDFFSEALGQVKLVANASTKAVERIIIYEEEVASNTLAATK